MANLSSFFDDVIEDNCVEPPIAVLKRIADDLTNKTNGMLIGEVKQTVSNENYFQLKFYIFAPALNNYSFLAFVISHDFGLYPLTVVSPLQEEIIDEWGETRHKEYKVEKAENFEETLKQIFLSPATKRVINGLLTQIKSA